MKPQEILRKILSQVPPSYPLVITQGGEEIAIADVSFSHQPQQVTIKLVPRVALLPEPEATIAELRAGFIADADVKFEFESTPIGKPGPFFKMAQEAGTIPVRVAHVTFVFMQDAVGGYVAIARGHPGLATEGETMDDLRDNVNEACKAFFGYDVPVQVMEELPPVSGASVAFNATADGMLAENDAAVPPVAGELDAGEVQHQRVHPEEVAYHPNIDGPAEPVGLAMAEPEIKPTIKAKRKPKPTV